MDDVLTVPQMESLLSDNGMGVLNAVTTLERAERTYDQETSRSRYLSDAAHELSFGEQLPALEAAERHAAGMAEVAERNARSVLTQIRDMTRPTLAPDELAAASARLPVVSAEIERAPLATVLSGIRRAIATGDRVGQYTYWQLLGTAPPKPRPHEGPGVPLPPDEREEAERNEVRRLLSRIEGELRSKEFDPLKAKAETALERAQTSRARATKRRERARIDVDLKARGFVPYPPEAA